ncbi:MAG: uridylate kinase [Methyloprofundus sp.]|nr:uridylate kinase [Methyloprofundus sp.]MDT8424950.1 uridylate kinase [Methyloprofundus sp.]
MIILKLGGSLLSSQILPQWLHLAVKEGKGKVVIVPGGGVFADQVRSTQKTWQYDDQTAHYMAILAMQQMALLFKGLCSDLCLVNQVEAIRPALYQKKTVVWSPLAIELDDPNIKASWDVTSDTLAAWLAVQLSADQLILVKSAQLPENATLEQLSEKNIIDQALTDFVQHNPITVNCVNLFHTSALSASLKKNV